MFNNQVKISHLVRCEVHHLKRVLYTLGNISGIIITKSAAAGDAVPQINMEAHNTNTGVIIACRCGAEIFITVSIIDILALFPKACYDVYGKG